MLVYIKTLAISEDMFYCDMALLSSLFVCMPSVFEMVIFSWLENFHLKLRKIIFGVSLCVEQLNILTTQVSITLTDRCTCN